MRIMHLTNVIDMRESSHEPKIHVANARALDAGRNSIAFRNRRNGSTILRGNSMAERRCLSALQKRGSKTHLGNQRKSREENPRWSISLRRMRQAIHRYCGDDL